MKLKSIVIGVGLVVVVALVLVALATLGRSTWPAPTRCIGRVVIVQTPPGHPSECICAGGVLSACFDPGL